MYTSAFLENQLPYNTSNKAVFAFFKTDTPLVRPSTIAEARMHPELSKPFSTVCKVQLRLPTFGSTFNWGIVSVFHKPKDLL